MAFMQVNQITAMDAWWFARLGLQIKLIAMWLLLLAWMIPMVFQNQYGLLMAFAFPLGLDFIGRCFCGFVRIGESLAVKISILCQFFGILGLCVFTVVLGWTGLAVGLIWASLFQWIAAGTFVSFLKGMAIALQAPDIYAGLDQVHSRVLRTGVSFYTALSFSAFVLALAIICGLFLFVIGLIITIPLALLVMLPLVAATLGAYFLLLYGYQAQLRALRTQIQLQHLDVARSLAENI